MALVKQRRRVAVPPQAARLSVGESLTITDPESLQQLVAVLRVKRGLELEGVDFEQQQGYLLRISEADRRCVVLEVLDLLEATSPPCLPVVLYASLLKEKSWEWLLQKATELGVSRIQPVLAAECQEGGQDAKRLARWQAIVQQAALQCERLALPTLEDAQPLAALVADASPSVVLVERQPQLPCLLEALPPNWGQGAAPLGVWVGPEGGWHPDELESLLAAGVQGVHLGRFVLKAETAAMLACGSLLLMYKEG